MEKFDNGTSTFLLEENVNYIEYVETKNSSYRSRFYYHGNIMICNVGTNNKINWINNLLRNEYHQRDYAYFYFIVFLHLLIYCVLLFYFINSFI